MEGKSKDAAEKTMASGETLSELPLIPEIQAIVNEGAASGKSDGEEPSLAAGTGARDPNWRAKRNRSNRLSSLRARIRKREYVMKLEERVQDLKAEAFMLTSKKLYFKNEITYLKIENQKLLHRLEICGHEEVLRKAQLEAITNEVNMLRQLVFQEHLRRRTYHDLLVTRPPPRPPIHEVADFDLNYPCDQNNPELNDQEVGDHDHDGAEESASETGSEGDEVDG